MPLDAKAIENFIHEFYKQADDSAPLVWFLPYVEDDFHMVWTPTCQFDGPVGFEEFYRNLTGTCSTASTRSTTSTSTSTATPPR